MKKMSVLIAGIILFSFQNCAVNSMSTDTSPKQDVLSSESATDPEALEDSVAAASSPTAITPSGSTTPSTLAPLSAEDCYFNYVTAFPWTNSDQDAMTVAPVLGSSKLGTLKVFNSNSVSAASLKSALPFSGSAAWKFYFIRSQKEDGTSSLSSYLNKLNENDSSTQLDCVFGPILKSASCDVADPSGRISYQNIGVGLNGVDGQTGFLSCSTKFIACKVTKGSAPVVLHSETGATITTNSFIIKRGCYQ